MRISDHIHTTQNLPALTGLRGFAALWVFILHACFGNVNEYGYFPALDHKINFGPFENFILHGHLAVDIFFILSGFILTHVYSASFERKPQGAALGFYLKRLARIYPAHMAITAVLAGLFFTGVWQPIRPLDGKDVALSVTLLNVWSDPSVNIPAWSISAEWFAYLAAPFLIYFSGKITKPWAIVLTVLGLTIAYPYLFKLFFCCSGLYGGGAILRVFSGFLIGTIVHRLYRLDPKLPLKGDLLFLISFASLFILTSLQKDISFTYPILPFLFFGLATSKGLVFRFFASRTMGYLGVISYCIYLVHYPVLEIAAALFSDYFYDLDPTGHQGMLWLFLSGLTVFLIIAATALYYGIEKPCRQWITARIDR